MTGILLVLRGVHTGIICHADDHTGIHAGVGNGEQRVCRHVQAHVLHSAEAALTGQACAEGCFHSHLFVGRPLSVDLFVGSDTFGNFRTGGAGIAGYKAAATLIQASGNGFVAKH